LLVIPAHAGIQSLSVVDGSKPLESGVRRNDER